MPSTFSRTSTLHRAVFTVFSIATLLVCSFAATQAHAANGPQYGSIGQYGEVTRFGGFDSGAYDNEKYDGALTAGKFLNPVGFAVDTQDKTAGGDGTAIYVLDRVSDYAAYAGPSGTVWRLQKLSDTGTVLGTSEFYLPKTGTSALGINNPVGVLGLAVDDKTGQIYTIVYKTTGAGSSATPYADEIIDWSTTPNGSKQLVAPGALSSITPVSGYTAPGLLGASSDELASASTPLYDPQGLTLDVSGGQDDLAIEADKNLRAGNGTPQGPAVVGQVPTSGGSVGVETESWSAASLSGISNSDVDAIAAGISTNSDGSLDVLLNPTIGGSLLDAIDLPADLTSAPTVLAASGIDPSNGDAAPLLVGDSSGNRASAGPQAVELSNGLYASDFYENTADAGYWEKGVNEGIRLVSPELGGLLSNPFAPATSIFDTLGNETSGGACNIGNGGAGGAPDGVSLAAGANGTIWALTAGQDSSAWGGSGSDAAFTSGRQIIELEPNAGTACVQPTGTFSVANAAPGSQTQEASTPLTVAVGSTVDFDASTIKYPTSGGVDPASVYSYEWDPTGSGDYTTISDTLSAPGDFNPPTTASYQYTKPGVYSAELKLLGDFGEYDEAGTIVVQATSPPTAAFTAPATAQTGQSVTFDASASQPANGTQIADYRWNFGDGSTDETQDASDAHTYASPGTYTVTLQVLDNDERESAAVNQQITIGSPPSNGGGSSPATSSGSPVATVDRSATNVSPKAVESGGNVVVTVSCPTTKVSCAGTAEVKTASAVAVGALKSTKSKKKVLVLGQKTFSLNGDQRETLTIKISSTGLALLKKSKRLKVLVVVSAHDSYGDPGSKTLTLTLTTPSKKK